MEETLLKNTLIITKDYLGRMRDKLLREKCAEKKNIEYSSGYVDGVLDLHNSILKINEKLNDIVEGKTNG